jgi:hypothetical protein
MADYSYMTSVSRIGTGELDFVSSYLAPDVDLYPRSKFDPGPYEERRPVRRKPKKKPQPVLSSLGERRTRRIDLDLE